jgi:hypothetical protein
VSPPYGTPLKTFTPSCTTPLIFPAVVVAIGAPSAHAKAFPRNATEAAAIPETCNKVRRLNRFIKIFSIQLSDQFQRTRIIPGIAASQQKDIPAQLSSLPRSLPSPPAVVIVDRRRCLVVTIAVASEIGLGFSPDIKGQTKRGL